MSQTLTNLLLAQATTTLVYSAWEIQNMRGKLRRLSAYIQNKPYKELPINVNTRAKSYSISLLGLMVFVGPFWLVYTWLDIRPEAAIKVASGLLLASFVTNAIMIDKWHVDIEKITRPFKKKV